MKDARRLDSLVVHPPFFSKTFTVDMRTGADSLCQETTAIYTAYTATAVIVEQYKEAKLCSRSSVLGEREGLLAVSVAASVWHCMMSEGSCHANTFSGMSSWPTCEFPSLAYAKHSSFSFAEAASV